LILFRNENRSLITVKHRPVP